ncbi:MAG: OB-fold domain-containing protein [Rhodococcus sp. (in: high G+C Gram-positive bacteria)]|uniref:Zn-ribbon domain-containing OB-fold protein n=1 Tax=Rhodococcus sp. TaxID=1831 RepID=UPI003BAFF453
MTDRPTPALPEMLAVINPDHFSEPFWAKARAHVLVCQQCTACGTHRMPPSPICFACQSSSYDWDTLPGTGTIFTFTVTRHAFVPYLKGLTPYVVAVIDLDGAPGARLVSNIVNGPEQNVSIGARVRVVWDDVTDMVTTPKFDIIP